MRSALQHTDWEALLEGDAETKTCVLTTKLLALQQQYVPSRTYLTKSGDPVWFIITTGLPPRPSMPPARGWPLPAPGWGPEEEILWPRSWQQDLVTTEQIERLLSAVDVTKAIGPDDVSPRLLKRCTKELSGPLSTVFTSCLRENKWPLQWKEARVVSVHKNSRSEPSNYRPVALLSVVCKVLERIVAEVICQYLSENHLLSDRQFGFRPGRSTSDLLLSKDWQDALDEDLDTLVIALDIAGAFDRVWHARIVEKLRSKGIQGDLLVLFQDYL